MDDATLPARNDTNARQRTKTAATVDGILHEYAAKISALLQLGDERGVLPEAMPSHINALAKLVDVRARLIRDAEVAAGESLPDGTTNIQVNTSDLPTILDTANRYLELTTDPNLLRGAQS